MWCVLSPHIHWFLSNCLDFIWLERQTSTKKGLFGVYLKKGRDDEDEEGDLCDDTLVCVMFIELDPSIDVYIYL